MIALRSPLFGKEKISFLQVKCVILQQIELWINDISYVNKTKLYTKSMHLPSCCMLLGSYHYVSIGMAQKIISSTKITVVNNLRV